MLAVREECVWTATPPELASMEQARNYYYTLRLGCSCVAKIAATHGTKPSKSHTPFSSQMGMGRTTAAPTGQAQPMTCFTGKFGRSQTLTNLPPRPRSAGKTVKLYSSP